MQKYSFSNIPVFSYILTNFIVCFIYDSFNYYGIDFEGFDHEIGKSDALDAHRIAATRLALSDDRLHYPRADHGLRI